MKSKSQMPQQPQMTEDMMMMGGMQDELSMIEQDLNMTRRATRSSWHFINARTTSLT